MSVQPLNPSSATADSLTAQTVYMFSCDKCPAHKLLGNPLPGHKIHAMPDENGNFREYVMKIGQRPLSLIQKGYIGYSPEKLFFTLSQWEAEENFGQHVCPSRLFFQPHLDPYAEQAPPKKIASQRLKTASLECKTTIEEGMQALILADNTKKAPSKRSRESTYDLLIRTGEAARLAFGAPAQKRGKNQDPWGLAQEDSARTSEAAPLAFEAPAQKRSANQDPWRLVQKDSARTSEAAHLAFKARNQKRRGNKDPGRLVQEGYALKQGQEKKFQFKNEIIDTLCTTLAQCNLGHLRFSRPDTLNDLSEFLSER